MKLKPWQLKLMLNAFPPLLVNRVQIRRISPDFKEMDVRVKKSLLNKNLGGAIFGGSIFSAADPYYSIMYWQIFNHQGYACEAWLKAAEIRYRKPSRTNLIYEFRLTDEDVQEALETIEERGKFEKWHHVNAVDKSGDICAEVKTLVYLRKTKGKGSYNF